MSGLTVTVLFRDFNPRSPHRERHKSKYKRANMIPYFNPRSPHRERLVQTSIIKCTRQISIHAPLTGSDAICKIFEPGIKISIHAPLTGSDFNVFDNGDGVNISIHAPLTGSDFLLFSAAVAINNFNPRSPHRERRSLKLCKCCFPIFQSTLPSQGATGYCVGKTTSITDFNPRSPHRERRQILQISLIHTKFQSTLPSQGATHIHTQT